MRSFFTYVLFLFILYEKLECIEGRHLKPKRIYTSFNPQKHKELLRKHHGKMFLDHSTNLYVNANPEEVHATSTSPPASAVPPSPAPPVAGDPHPAPPGHDVSAFRPTAPGHSPGDGHSLNN
ncbi:hypothetical protein K2173_006035 [Erythroxylum novogranatense]|uniref:Uncharacterized protein n=1 Tax=Erythroxylum novogranatense TaxID=1862640 RepID=A0AAV8TE21_9ROSI|nr:hypothetical protein K2173_006035 [Erythroxylum novogranatense]